jgi:hypothetical protein
MKKLLIITISMISLTSIARPHGHHGWHHRGHHGHFHHCGRHSWIAPAAIVGGALVAGAISRVYDRPTVVQPIITTPVTPTYQVVQPVQVNSPTVVRTPVPVTQRVWVEGRYEDQVQPNGVIVRVWIPGHYQTVVTYR